MFSKENKTFKYQAKSSGPPQTDIKQQKGAHPAGGGGGGGVRVAAGDKCVAPVKSKPKKRKSVKEPSYGTLSIDNVEWTDQTYGVKDLAKKFHGSFPLIVKVAQGYYGDFGTEISTNQVLQIHSYGKQRRVWAEDSRGRQVSLPYDYPIEVALVGDTSGERMTFKEVVKTKTLPLRVKVLKQSAGVALTNVHMEGEELEVTRVYDDMFLRANSISGGWINQQTVDLIPSFLEVEFSVAIGMRAAREEDWRDYRNMFSLAVRHLLFHLLVGYSGIVSQDQAGRQSQPYRGSVGIQYQYTNTGTRSEVQYGQPSIADQQQHDPVYDNLQTLPPRPPKSNRLSRSFNVGGGGSKLPSAAPRPVSGSHEEFRSLPLVAPHYAGSKDSPPAAAYQNHGFDRNNEDDVELSAFDPPPANLRVEEAQVHAEDPSPRGRASMPFSEIDEADIPSMFNHVIKLGEESMEREKKVDIDAFVPSRSMRAINVVPPTFRENPSSVENPYEMTIMTASSASNTVSSAYTKLQLQETSSIEKMEDVPSEIHSLTVSDVCKCLELLNMEKHIEQFRQNQMDGKLLVDIKEEVLLKEFNFTPFNASKLQRFIRGWRPKIL